MRQELPPCVAIDSPALGKPCAECPSLPDCNALAAGQLIINQNARITTLENENARLAEQHKQDERTKLWLFDRLFDLSTDTLVTTALTPGGLRDYVTHNEAVRNNLRQGNWGVVRMDGRFVNYMNKWGNLAGDAYLKYGGGHVTAVVRGFGRLQGDRRQRNQPVVEDERLSLRRNLDNGGGEPISDTICRQGGDEFSLICYGVTPAELAVIAARIQYHLTVGAAVERYSNGEIPFIASVGAAHAEQTDIRPKVQGRLAEANFYEAFNIVNSIADDAQREAKTQQYAEMWRLAYAALPAELSREYFGKPKPNNDRFVAQCFLQHLCPDFYHDPTSFFNQQTQNA